MCACETQTRDLRLLIFRLVRVCVFFRCACFLSLSISCFYFIAVNVPSIIFFFVLFCFVSIHKKCIRPPFGKLSARTASGCRCANVCSFRFISSEIKWWVLFLAVFLCFFSVLLVFYLVHLHLVCSRCLDVMQSTHSKIVASGWKCKMWTRWLLTQFMAFDLNSTLEFVFPFQRIVNSKDKKCF